MKQSPNILWAAGPPIALLALAMAYYINAPSFRAIVDARVPSVSGVMARFVREPKVVIIDDRKAATVTRLAEANQPASVPQPEAAPSSIAPVSEVPKPQIERLSPLREEVDLQTLNTDRSSWPKAVALKRTVEFPAVVNGKVVGKLTAPVGALANLMRVQDGKVGVEYRGGGAWLEVKETDVLERMRAARMPNALASQP